VKKPRAKVIDGDGYTQRTNRGPGIDGVPGILHDDVFGDFQFQTLWCACVDIDDPPDVLAEIAARTPASNTDFPRHRSTRIPSTKPNDHHRDNSDPHGLCIFESHQRPKSDTRQPGQLMHDSRRCTDTLEISLNFPSQGALPMKHGAFAATCIGFAALSAHAGEAADAALPLAVLLEAAHTSLAACKANGYDVTVTVVDSDTTTRLVLRADGAGNRTVEIGYRKAYTVAKTGMSSKDFGKSVTQDSAAPPRPTPGTSGPPPMPAAVNGDPNLITWAGGLPIMVNGRLVGAMSASGAPGGDKDEACVNAGVATIHVAGK
jgi:uncharacterized protein GlcG (DUF336 family)